MRRRSLIVRLALSALTAGALTACSARDKPRPSPASPPPTGAGEPVKEGPFCAGRSCGACVSESGCWWCTSLKRCISDGEKDAKACPDAQLPHDEPDCPK